MMTGSAPTGSMTPPICAAGADVDARADLRARADQRVRVDQRSLADVGADVHVHRRHADDAGREVGAVADRRSAGHDADAGGEPGLLQRQRVLVVERQRPWSIDASTMSPNRKPSRMPCFTQVLTRQPVGARRIGLGGAHRARPTAPRAAARTPSRAASRSARRARGDQIVDLVSSMRVPAIRRARAQTSAPSAGRAPCSTLVDLLLRLGRRRHHRQPVHLLEQSHRRHRGLHRHRVRLRRS